MLVIKFYFLYQLKEIFGAGTACVVCPVDRILFMEKDIAIPTMETGGEVAKRFYKELTDIQVRREDGWRGYTDGVTCKDSWLKRKKTTTNYGGVIRYCSTAPLAIQECHFSCLLKYGHDRMGRWYSSVI